MKSQGRIPADTPTKLHGHAYILYGHSPRPLAEEGLLLVGDAAGLAYAESGEGIRPAIESGLLAAQTVLDARGDYSAPALRAYNDKIIARFGDRTAPPQSAPAIAAVKEWAAAFLLSTRWFSRRVLLEHWFLHIQQPALVAR